MQFQVRIAKGVDADNGSPPSATMLTAFPQNGVSNTSTTRPAKSMSRPLPALSIGPMETPRSCAALERHLYLDSYRIAIPSRRFGRLSHRGNTEIRLHRRANCPADHLPTPPARLTRSDRHHRGQYQ